jgi:hypothetical protein
VVPPTGKACTSCCARGRHGRDRGDKLRWMEMCGQTIRGRTDARGRSQLDDAHSVYNIWDVRYGSTLKKQMQQKSFYRRGRLSHTHAAHATHASHTSSTTVQTPPPVPASGRLFFLDVISTLFSRTLFSPKATPRRAFIPGCMCRRVLQARCGGVLASVHPEKAHSQPHNKDRRRPSWSADIRSRTSDPCGRPCRSRKPAYQPGLDITKIWTYF